MNKGTFCLIQFYLFHNQYSHKSKTLLLNIYHYKEPKQTKKNIKA